MFSDKYDYISSISDRRLIVINSCKGERTIYGSKDLDFYVDPERSPIQLFSYVDDRFRRGNMATGSHETGPTILATLNEQSGEKIDSLLRDYGPKLLMTQDQIVEYCQQYAKVYPNKDNPREVGSLLILKEGWNLNIARVSHNYKNSNLEIYFHDYEDRLIRSHESKYKLVVPIDLTQS